MVWQAAFIMCNVEYSEERNHVIKKSAQKKLQPFQS